MVFCGSSECSHLWHRLLHLLGELQTGVERGQQVIAQTGHNVAMVQLLLQQSPVLHTLPETRPHQLRLYLRGGNHAVLLFDHQKETQYVAELRPDQSSKLIESSIQGRSIQGKRQYALYLYGCNQL